MSAEEAESARALLAAIADELTPGRRDKDLVIAARELREKVERLEGCTCDFRTAGHGLKCVLYDGPTVVPSRHYCSDAALQELIDSPNIPEADKSAMRAEMAQRIARLESEQRPHLHIEPALTALAGWRFTADQIPPTGSGWSTTDRREAEEEAKRRFSAQQDSAGLGLRRFADGSINGFILGAEWQKAREAWGGPPTVLRGAAVWGCGKCARERMLGHDDGEIPEHHRSCEKRDGNACRCTGYSEDRGGGHFELMLEPEPDCPEHGAQIAAETGIDAGARIIHGNYSEEPWDFTAAVWARGTLRAALRAIAGDESEPAGKLEYRLTDYRPGKLPTVTITTDPDYAERFGRDPKAGVECRPFGSDEEWRPVP